MRWPKTAFRLIVLFTGLFLIISAITVWALSSRAYFVMTYLDNTSVVWHDDEAFIFVNRTTSAKQMQMWKAFLEGVGFGWTAPERLHEDLLVFHIQGAHLEKYELLNFGRGGGGFPYQGQLYFSRGGEPQDWPYIWKWMGTNFSRLQKNDALNILNQFQYTSDQFKKEGWNENPNIVFNDSDRRYEISLASHVITLITRSRESGVYDVRLEGRLAPESREILLHCDEGHYRMVSEQNYLELKERKPHVSAN